MNGRRARLGSGFRDIGGRRRGAREVKLGQAEPFESPTESTGLRTVPTDKPPPPPPPPPPCAHGSRGFDADTRRKRLRRVNRNAGHEATDARENGHRSSSLHPLFFLSNPGRIPHLPTIDRSNPNSRLRRKFFCLFENFLHSIVFGWILRFDWLIFDLLMIFNVEEEENLKHIVFDSWTWI